MRKVSSFSKVWEQPRAKSEELTHDGVRDASRSDQHNQLSFSLSLSLPLACTCTLFYTIERISSSYTSDSLAIKYPSDHVHTYIHSHTERETHTHTHVSVGGKKKEGNKRNDFVDTMRILYAIYTHFRRYLWRLSIIREMYERDTSRAMNNKLLLTNTSIPSHFLVVSRCFATL